MGELTYGLFDKPANHKRAESLRSQGHNIVSLPAPVIEPSGAFPLDAAGDSGWLIFADVHSAEVFLGDQYTGYDLDNVRVCALGEAVADRLRFSMIHSDIIPATLDPQSVFETISEYQDVSGVSFTLLAREAERYVLSDILKNNGAEVTEYAVYKAVLPADAARLRTLLIGGAIDHFIFADAHDVFDITLYADINEIDCKMIAADESAYQALLELRAKPQTDAIWR